MTEENFAKGVLRCLRELIRPDPERESMLDQMDSHFDRWDFVDDGAIEQGINYLIVEVSGLFFEIDYRVDFEGNETGEVYRDWYPVQRAYTVSYEPIVELKTSVES